jgi:hypothetical protein
MKGGAFKAKTFFAGAKCAKILCGFWHYIRAQFDYHAAESFTVSGNIQIASGKLGILFFAHNDFSGGKGAIENKMNYLGDLKTDSPDMHRLFDDTPV